MSLNKIKSEIFFLKELYRFGYRHPKYWWQYVKNKFLNQFFLDRIKPISFQPEGDFELHILCQKKDVWILIWSLKSFLHYSGLRPKIFIHDDGSIDKQTAIFLETKFSSLKVISMKEADEFIEARNDLTPALLDHRKNGHPLIFKLIDIFLMSQSSKIMVLDSDVLFFKKPEEIIDFINGAINKESLISKHNGEYDLMVKNEYYRVHSLKEKETEFMNSGIILFKKSAISKEKLFEYFDNTTRGLGDYFVEMAGWGCLISQTDFQFLPIDKYAVKGRFSDNLVAKHFTSPRRHEMFAYGIDRVREKIGY